MKRRKRTGDFNFCLCSGALFCLNGSATLVRQEDAARPSLVAPCSLSGLSRTLCSCCSGQQKASGAEREGKNWKSRESAPKNQNRTVKIAQRHKYTTGQKEFKQNRFILFSYVRMRPSKTDLHPVHRPREEKKKKPKEGKLQPIRNMLQKVRKICVSICTLTTLGLSLQTIIGLFILQNFWGLLFGEILFF